MQILALETDIQKLKKKFLAPTETEIFTVKRHIFSFLIGIAVDVLITILFLAVAITLVIFDFIPPLWVNVAAFAIWFLFVFFSALKAYIDWQYDFVTLTDSKLLIVEQTSFLHQSITPVNLENIVEIGTGTQWLNIFKFGVVNISLWETPGHDISLRFMPKASDVAARISQQITLHGKGGRERHRQ